MSHYLADYKNVKEHYHINGDARIVPGIGATWKIVDADGLTVASLTGPMSMGRQFSRPIGLAGAFTTEGLEP